MDLIEGRSRSNYNPAAGLFSRSGSIIRSLPLPAVPAGVNGPAQPSNQAQSPAHGRRPSTLPRSWHQVDATTAHRHGQPLQLGPSPIHPAYAWRPPPQSRPLASPPLQQPHAISQINPWESSCGEDCLFYLHILTIQPSAARVSSTAAESRSSQNQWENSRKSPVVQQNTRFDDRSLVPWSVTVPIAPADCCQQRRCARQ